MTDALSHGALLLHSLRTLAVFTDTEEAAQLSHMYVEAVVELGSLSEDTLDAWVDVFSAYDR